MKKSILAGLAGGIILFVWGVIAWTVLPLHDYSMKNIANEDAVIETLRANLPEHAVYLYPGMPTRGDERAMTLQ